jgi:exonuclease VII large subunit
MRKKKMNDSPKDFGAEAPVAEPIQAETADVAKPFHQAYQDYLTALKDYQLDAQKRYLQTHREYTNALQSHWVDTQNRLQDINRVYVAQVQDAWGDENAQKVANDAYRTYAQTLRDTYDDNQKRCQDAQDSYTKPVQELADEMKKNCERAYQNYVSAIKDAWAATDPGAFDAQTFAAINNCIAAATWYALYTVGPRSAK